MGLFFKLIVLTQKVFHQQKVNWIQIQNILFDNWIIIFLSVHRGTWELSVASGITKVTEVNRQNRNLVNPIVV